MGYYVMGKTQSVAWFSRVEEAKEEAKRLNYRGGQHYHVEADDDSKQLCSICRREHGLEVIHACE